MWGEADTWARKTQKNNAQRTDFPAENETIFVCTPPKVKRRAGQKA